jgi:AcrR family transcriptional regulator
MIVAAAVRLSRTPEANAVSFRRLGGELGVDPTALYRHFADKGDLVSAVLDRLWSDVVAQVPPGLAWRARWSAAADLFVAAIVDHPAVGVQAGHRVTGGPGERAAVDLHLGCLVEAGLDDADVVRFYALMSSYVLGVATAQAGYRLHDGRIARAPDREWVGNMRADDIVRFPHLDRFADALAALSDDDVFRTGLDLLLDAIEEAGSAEM